MLEVRDLEVVEAIAVHGSFARAARVLGISQPALTRHVAGLEHRLRGTLFIRGNQGVEQTDLCRVLMVDAADLLARFRALGTRLGHVRGDPDRDLAIVSGTYAAETIGLPALAKMLAAHSRIQVRFNALNWVQALARLRDRDAELAILEISEFGNEPDLVIEPLSRHPGAFAARAGHPLVGQISLTLPDILRFPFFFIGRTPDRVAQPLVSARQKAQSFGVSYPAFPAAIVESPTAALLAARVSDAVVAVTGSIVAPWLRSGDIVLLPWHEPWFATEFGIVHLRARPPSSEASTFIECLRQADHVAQSEDSMLLAAVAAAGHGNGDAAGSPGSTGYIAGP